MLVLTPTASENIENIKTALESSNAVLIQGEIGCGKSLTVDYLATALNAKENLIQVDVDDSFDSKDLLGKFSATETPGTFEWIPGPLTIAVEKGYWILMEDIDLASFDVFSVLLSLLENSTLFVSDKNKVITAHPNFKLIATQQILVSGQTMFSKKNTIPYQELWGCVIMQRIPPKERCDIVRQLCSRVPLAVLESLTELSENSSNVNALTIINLRSLLRWGRRVHRRLEHSASLSSDFISSTIREMMLKEAFDCFAARFCRGSEQSMMLELISTACGVELHVAETLVLENKPQQLINTNGCTFGRVSLPIHSISRITRTSRIAFAETRQAMSLLERLAAAVENKEHVLLTGETGVGKTFVVQYLADQLGQKLIVHNLNQQTDTSDFMGGWKPLDLGIALRELYNEFLELFQKSFNVEKNAEFLNALQTAFSARNWERTARLIRKGCTSFSQKQSCQSKDDCAAGDGENLTPLWLRLQLRAEETLETVRQTSANMAFFFEEGSLVKAWREGHWILLDELNLATTEVLERVSTVLGDVDRIFLTDKGSAEAIPRHKNFHVFANMNPPTDVGKKDLPPSLRSRFTECFVSEPFNSSDISVIVREYIGFLAPDAKIGEISDFFLDCVANAKTKLCSVDGESKPPSFSMRTLTRALSYVRKATPHYGFQVSLFDGLLLGFATPLQRQFHKVVEGLIVKNIFRGRHPPPPKLPVAPSEGECVAYEHIWIKAGEKTPTSDEGFILTDSVKGHLTNLARAVFAQRPVLLEGPTSSGKSSMVKYLADLTGNTFVRINNHESTEVQEYLGHYVTDEYGKLRFVDGILVNAVRKGYWVVLDELNLAPTDVLEALNRLLDDNCELFIPDTQETIQPHPDLRIFATQNPAGIYGGRKLLSRAFRNRFLEITVDDIPTDEIVTILRQRYAMPEGFAVKIVEVMTTLQLRRQNSQIFAGRHGFITPRDLFRWAERKPLTYQQLAEHGFLLLGERCRKDTERQIVKDVIETVTKTEISEAELYSPMHWEFVKQYYNRIEDGSIDEFKIVWTESMQRLFTVVGVCLEHCEPVLLVGETGSSKTTVCQLWAALLDVPLRIINCHQHTEAADFLGSLRPVPPDRRDSALFEWRDGPLVESMRQGDFFLLDEISLTEDSVLERLNSVLEPSRSITLAEKSSGETFEAHERFRVMATMNPGGDFGKKELSPALRNRFTEVYVRPTTEEEEVATILSKRLVPELSAWAVMMARVLCGVSSATHASGRVAHISIRDIIGWVEFMNAVHGRCPDAVAFVHGLDALLLDGVGVGSGQLEGTSEMIKRTCIEEAEKAVGKDVLRLLSQPKPFWELLEGMPAPELPPHLQDRFFFGAPTTQRNLSKLMRSTVLRKAVLLEGSPGVGKTSIVEALGAALQTPVVRINLSEQTDIMDLFGTFLPQGNNGVEGNEEAATATGPQFVWSDGVLLQALKEGSWAILDELNLASQSVLEGLNALLDHRAAVFIPELNKEFHAHPNFRVFACQNPLAEGGGRKGLPRSFLNRFVKVRVEAFTREDLVMITQAVCPDIEVERLSSMVDFVAELQQKTMVERLFGLRGSPWEFNLRDVLRWAGLMRRYDAVARPQDFTEMLFVQRFRTDEDRAACRQLLRRFFPEELAQRRHYSSDFLLDQNMVVYQGRRLLERRMDLDTELGMEEVRDAQRSLLCEEAEPDLALSQQSSQLFASSHHNKTLLMLPSQADSVSALLMCAAHNQFAMLIGTSGSGKTFALRNAAALAGARLVTYSITASTDAIDLLGGFDQVEGKQGQFEWRDSLILEAMLQGHWLVLDNVNYCNASALDRLNPLVEPNGVLSVNEQGQVNGATRVIRPHPNFRLFATMNPRYGEISRAMRNRAVELCVFPVSIPSIEANALCWTSAHLSCASSFMHETALSLRSTHPLVEDMEAEGASAIALLAQFHHRFVLQAFHADSESRWSPLLADATSAGAPNIFTLLRASNMLKLSRASFIKSVSHCYLDNRVGSWLHQRDPLCEIMYLLAHHLETVKNGEDEEEIIKEEDAADVVPSVSDVPDSEPRLQDALNALILGSPSHLKHTPQLLERRLMECRVARSGLALKKMLSGRASQAPERVVEDVLLWFVLDEVTDGAVLEGLTAARHAFIASCGLPTNVVDAAAALLQPKYCTPTMLPRLFCLSMMSIGPHADVVEAARRSSFSLSDSPAVNRAAQRIIAAARECLADVTDPTQLQDLLRALSPLVRTLLERGGRPLTQDNFVPVVTNALLFLDSIQEHQDSLGAHGMDVRAHLLSFLEAVQRHLDIGFPLSASESPIQRYLIPKVHITTAEERATLEAFRELQRSEWSDDSSNRSSKQILRPLWRIAAFRAEFALIQLLLRVLARSLQDLGSGAPDSLPFPLPPPSIAVQTNSLRIGLKHLHNEISSFLKTFTQHMPLYSTLDLTLWDSLSKALDPAVHPRALDDASFMELVRDAEQYAPLLVCHLFQRYELQSMGFLSFGSWAAAAFKCVRFASEVPVVSIGATASEHDHALACLRIFLSSCPRTPRDPFDVWRSNMLYELLQILTCCVPSTKPLCVAVCGSREPISPSALMPLVESAWECVEKGDTGIVVGKAEKSLLHMLVDTLRQMAAMPSPAAAAAGEANSRRALPLRAIAILCALKCHYLLPSTPIDPMYRQAQLVTIATAETRVLDRVIEANTWASRLGQRHTLDPAPHMEVLHSLKALEAGRLAASSLELKERPDATGKQFALLTRELHRLTSTFLCDERLQHILSSSATVESVDAWGELLFQEIGALLQQYVGYEDATLHLAQSAFFAAVSSRVWEADDGPAAGNGNATTTSTSTGILEGLHTTLEQLQFPYGLSGKGISLPALGSTHLLRRLRYLDSCLIFLRGSVPHTVSAGFSSGVFALFRSLYRYVEEQNERDKTAAEMAVKYKERSLLIEGDDEMLLRKLQTLFPTYESEFDVATLDEEGAASDDDDESRVGNRTRILFADRDGAFVRHMAETFADFYHRLLQGKMDKKWLCMRTLLQSYQKRFDALSYDLHELQQARRWQRGARGSVEECALDDNGECLLLNGFAARSSLLSREFSAAAASVDERNAAGFNIFRDADPSEVRRFSLPLLRLQTRVEELLELYPDNVTLQQCRRIAHKISQLPALKVPLMKVMTGCEVLLRQCYEWQRNASQAVSLMSQMTELSAFVLRWRRLELHCWGHVFKAKKEEFALHAALYWFELYDTAHGEENDGDEDATSLCIRWFQRLTQYLWGASVGDFGMRLTVARGMAFELACRCGLTAPMTNVAMHVVGFFTQFEKFVAEKCAAAVRPLEEDMEEFCRIMRWEDANYYAVRATVEKSHLKVARVLAALEDALRAPALPLIIGEEERCEEDPSMGFPLPVTQDDHKKKKSSKKDEGKGGRKAAVGSKRQRDGKATALSGAANPAGAVIPMAGASADVLLWPCFGKAVRFLSDGADEIITNVAHLQAPKTPQQVKIRALKMMFERLAAAGVPCTHEGQVEHWEVLYGSTEALLACRTAFSEQLGVELLEEVAQEQYRVCRWVQRMREAERHPHQDLSGAQVKRGTGAVESLLAVLVTLSRWTFQLFELRDRLELLSQSIGAASKDESTKEEGEEITDGEWQRIYSTEVLEKSVQLASLLRVTCESLHWMEQEGMRAGYPDMTVPAPSSSSAESENRGLLMELQAETDRLWQLCAENERFHRFGGFLPSSVHHTLQNRLRRLRGVCGRLQHHSDAVVRAAAIMCEERCTEAMHSQLEMNDVEVDDSGRPASPLHRSRVEQDHTSESSAPGTLATLKRSLHRICESLEVAVPSSSPTTAAPREEVVSADPAADTVREEGEEDDVMVSEDGAYHMYSNLLGTLQQTTEEELQTTAYLIDELRSAADTDSVGTQKGPDCWWSSLSASECRETRHLLARVTSVVEEAKRGALRAMGCHARFSVVLSRLLAVLLKKGFCKKEEEEQDGDGDGDGGGQQDGTGMDDGEGQKDVTNEMENEDQLMNMKDKEEQKEEDKKKGEKNEEDEEDEEDNAADVETDFQGKKERREESEGDDEEGDESDQEMGSVDEEDDVQERKKSKRDKEDTESLNEDDGDAMDNNVEKDEFDENKQEGEDEETGGFENKEDEIRDADEDEKEEGDHELMADAGKTLEDEDMDSGDSASASSRSDGEEDKEEEGEEENDQLSTDDERDANSEREGSEERENEEERSNDERSSRSGEEEVEELNDAENDDEEENTRDAEDRPDENIYDGGQQDDRTGEEATENKEKNDQQDKQPDAAGTDEQQAGEEQEKDDAGRNWKQQQEQNAQSDRKDNSERQRSSQSNPYKAMKEALQRHQRQAMPQLNLSKQVEVPKDDGMEKEPPLPKREQEEGQDDQDSVEEFQFDEEGEKEGMAAAEEVMPTTAPEEPLNEEPDLEGSESAADDGEEDEPPQDSRMKRREQESEIKAEEDEAEEKRRRKSKKGSRLTSKPLSSDDSDAAEEEEEPEGAVEAESEKLARGRQRWQEHEAAVQALSQQLCEQLRLILAPTLADKLQGDYKTGKRLNMKRIIPYIASQFKKDRIWLRRTKPNKRAYQIVVALDDSLSMQCNRAGDLSCRAITLMAKALQQLEIGEIGVACFGAETTFLHRLEDPFTPECGPRIFSEIQFEQKSTRLGRFLETTLQYMDDAKERLSGQTRSTSQELLQLLYIFSDGQITENRADIRRLMARAEENHQVVVFVILDVKAAGGGAELSAPPAPPRPLDAKDLKGLSTAERLRRLKADRASRLQRVQCQSVLDMQLVEFEGGSVIRRNYMEDFPFPFYLIVRELDKLPEVVADSMRQWFELLNGH